MPYHHRDRSRARGASRQTRDRHHRLRHRPDLRRQDVAPGAALRRPDRLGLVQGQARTKHQGEKSVLEGGAEDQADRRQGSPRRVAEIAPPPAALHHRHFGLRRARCQRRPQDSLRRRTWHHARYRLRHLSVRDVVELHRERCVCGRRRAAGKTRRRARHQQGLHHARRRGAVSDRDSGRARRLHCARKAPSSAARPAGRGASDGSMRPSRAMRFG